MRSAMTRAAQRVHVTDLMVLRSMHAVFYLQYQAILFASNELAWYPAQRKSDWYTPMRFRLIKNGVAHVYDVYTV